MRGVGSVSGSQPADAEADGRPSLAAVAPSAATTAPGPSAASTAPGQAGKRALDEEGGPAAAAREDKRPRGKDWFRAGGDGGHAGADRSLDARLHATEVKAAVSSIKSKLSKSKDAVVVSGPKETVRKTGLSREELLASQERHREGREASGKVHCSRPTPLLDQPIDRLLSLLCSCCTACALLPQALGARDAVAANAWIGRSNSRPSLRYAQRSSGHGSWIWAFIGANASGPLHPWPKANPEKAQYNITMFATSLGGS